MLLGLDATPDRVVLALVASVTASPRNGEKAVQFPAIQRAGTMDEALGARTHGAVAVLRCHLTVELPAVRSDVLLCVQKGGAHTVFHHEGPKVLEADAVSPSSGSLSLQLV